MICSKAPAKGIPAAWMFDIFGFKIFATRWVHPMCMLPPRHQGICKDTLRGISDHNMAWRDEQPISAPHPGRGVKR